MASNLLVWFFLFRRPGGIRKSDRRADWDAQVAWLPNSSGESENDTALACVNPRNAAVTTIVRSYRPGVRHRVGRNFDVTGVPIRGFRTG